MESFKKKPTKRIALITGVAGAAVLGAVAVGGAAFADGPSAPSGAASAPAAPFGAPSGAPAAPSGAPAAPGQQSGSTAQGQQNGAPAAPPAPGAQGSGSQAQAPTPKPHIGGEVLSVSGSTVTVEDMDGFTRTITLSSDVTVMQDGSKSDTAAITKGVHVEATGSVDSNGTTLDATEVQIGQPAGPMGAPGTGGKGGQEGKGGRLPTPPAANGQAPAAPSGAPAAPQQQGGSQQAQPTPSQSAVQGS